MVGGFFMKNANYFSFSFFFLLFKLRRQMKIICKKNGEKSFFLLFRIKRKTISKNYYGALTALIKIHRQLSHVMRISHVRYINIQAWLRGFRVKIANFSSFFCPSIPKRDLNTKKTTPNIEVCPESLGAMLEY